MSHDPLLPPDAARLLQEVAKDQRSETRADRITRDSVPESRSSKSHRLDTMADAEAYFEKNNPPETIATRLANFEASAIHFSKLHLKELNDIFNNSSDTTKYKIESIRRSTTFSIRYINRIAGGRWGGEDKYRIRNIYIDIVTALSDNFSLRIESLLEHKKQFSLAEGTEDRLIQLEDFAQKHGGVGVAAFAKILFPELTEKLHSGQEAPHGEPLPSKAPEAWPGGRATSESPPEFIMRVYGQWMGKGLTVAHVRKLDQPLAQSFYNHLGKKRPLPEGFNLPTKYEANDRMIADLTSGRTGEEANEIIGEFTARQAGRIRSAMSRRRDK